MMFVLLQGTFTPLVHAHAGRTPVAQADNGLDGLARIVRCAYLTLNNRYATSPLRLSLAVMPSNSIRI